MRVFFLLLGLFAIVFKPSNLSAFSVQDGSCYGYNSDICSLAKREHELGNMFRFGLPAKSSSVKAYSAGISFVYQNNITSYFSVHSELGGDVIFETSPFSLYGFDGDISTGIRVYPWRQWFYLGTGVMLRGMYPLNATGATFMDDFSMQFYYFLELGFSFPSRGANFDINLRLRSDLLPLFGLDTMTKSLDPMAKMPFTFAIGYTGLFGKLGAVPAETTFDALIFERDQDAYLTFSNLFFESESSKLSKVNEAQIQNILVVAKSYNPTIIIVRGYGDIQDNNIRKQQKTANLRAQAILEYLVSMGVHKDKIVAVGIPSKRTTTQLLSERNQRAEIVLVR